MEKTTIFTCSDTGEVLGTLDFLYEVIEHPTRGTVTITFKSSNKKTPDTDEWEIIGKVSDDIDLDRQSIIRNYLVSKVTEEDEF